MCSSDLFALMELYGADLHDIIDEHAGIYFHGIDRIFECQESEIVVTNVISFEERRKKYAELLGKYYEAG